MKLSFKQTRIILITALFIIVVFCLYKHCETRSHEYPKELMETDLLCERNTDSTKIIIKGIANNKIQGNDAKWYFRFLKLKCKVKSNESISDDSEIKELLRHYEHSDEKNILSQVYYCAGCIYGALGDQPQAIDYFYKTLETIQNDNENWLKALCYYQLGNRYSLQDLYAEALPWQEKSLKEHMKSNNLIRSIYDYEELAWTEGNLGNTERALKYILEAKKTALSINDTTILPEIEGQIAIHYLKSDSHKLAKKHIDNALRWKKENNNELFNIALEIYSQLDIEDKSKEYCDSILKRGNIFGKEYAYWWLAKHYIRNNDYKAALSAIEQHKIYSDSTKKRTAAEASAKADALYYYGLREKENMLLQKKNATAMIYLTIAVSSFIVCLLLFILFYFRAKNKKEQMESRCHLLDEILKKEQENNENVIRRKEEEITNIKKQLSEIKEKNEQKRIELEKKLTYKEYGLQNIAFDNKQKELCEYELLNSRLYKEARICARDDSERKFKNWNEFERMIYNIYPGFEEKLQHFRKMNDIELKVCLLIRAGFNSSAIANITFRSQNTIYSICKRLYKKNFDQDVASSEWENLIRSIY